MNGSSITPDGEIVLEDLDGGIMVACVILGLSFLVGAPGNLLVIWTILRHIKQRSHTVVLILHLAAADLLVLVTLPLWIYSLARSWVFGEAVCKAMVYIINSCMYSSVFIITVMSMERFVVVRYPFVSVNWRKKKLLNKALLVLWVAAFLFSIPVIPTQVVDQVDGKEQCLFREYSSTGQEVVCLLLETLVGFVVPFSILVVCYSCICSRIAQMTFKSKRKSTLLIGSVVILFGLCWIPHHVGNLLSLVSIAIEKTYPNSAESLEATRATMAFIAGALVFISSTVNPLLYVFAARTFRSSLRDTGMKKLFHHISSSATAERTKELSFISKRQSSQKESSIYSTDSKTQIDVLLSFCENASP
ncbi:leukotriene B4 receptor 1 [Megalops cyprinoides]|uniref:leukotriene B4 receptor 1 n=1 Tax=Megalops cyprinoides TaxID=118141 RepID=UPI0018646242|nr:leukotriene B4 receptor 1 [Megalops cyprinoides]